MLAQLPVQIVEHNAGFDYAAFVFDVEFEHPIEMFRAVDHQRMIDGLPALGRAAAACKHRDAFLIGQTNRGLRLFYCARHNDADRHHLIMGSVGRITPTAEGIEQYIACDFPPELSLQNRHQHIHRLRAFIAAWRLWRVRCLTGMRV